MSDCFRTRHFRKFTSLDVESLEQRQLLTFTPLTIVAEADDRITSIANYVSVNDKGTIAFIGRDAQGASNPFIASDAQFAPRALGFPPNTNRDYGAVASINDSQKGDDQVAARERVSGNPAGFIGRLWNTKVQGASEIVASSTPADPEGLDSVVQWMDVNDENQLVFVGLDTDFGTVQKLRVRTSRSDVSTAIEIGDFPADARLRPQLSNEAEVVFRSPSGSSILKTNPNSGTFHRIAGIPEGFVGSAMGEAPGITDDGRAVAFVADQSSGAGVWVSLLRPSGDRTSNVDRQLVQIAGIEHELGENLKLSAFGRGSRVGVGGEISEQVGRASQIFITFLADDPTNGTETLWRVDLRLIAQPPQEGQAIGTYSVAEMSSPQPIARVGETLEFNLGQQVVERTIADLEVYDPVTNRGQVGFWASYTDGRSAVIRAAAPIPAVVNVVTHGFGRSFVYAHPYLGNVPIPMFGDAFLKNFLDLGEILEAIPEPGSRLDGKVESFVTRWNSSDGWAPALASLVAEQAFTALARLEELGGQTVASLAYSKAADFATEFARLQLLRARTFATAAAVDTVRSLLSSDLLQDPEATHSGRQVIHLIGHSRGAAVNALVARILVGRGYKIDQYTSLDGYSTDWPPPSDFLADIDIVGETGAVAGEIARKVNYRVIEPLDSIVLSVLADYPQLAAGLYGLPSATLSDTVRSLFDGSGDWRAPDRPGFENIVTVDTRGGIPTAHFALDGRAGIVELYKTTDDDNLPQSQRYILDNYVGQHRSEMSEPVPAIRAAEADQPPRKIPATAIPLEYKMLVDGTFEDVGSLKAEADGLPIDLVDDDFLRFWMTVARDEASLISAVWDASGDLQLVQSDQNWWLQMTASDSAEIGQLVVLDRETQHIDFDLKIVNVSPGDRLEIRYDDLVVTELELSTLAEHSRPLIEIQRPTSQSGRLSVRLVGNAMSPAIVQIDNLRVIAPRTVGDFDQDGQVGLADLNLLCQAIHGMNANDDFDLNVDGKVDADDLDELVVNLLGITYGDANLNGVFDSSDFVQVFQMGEYEDNLALNSTWATGDWNCDGEFDSGDLVKAFQAGGFVANAVRAALSRG